MSAQIRWKPSVDLSTERGRFLLSIYENPTDLIQRLAFADWLDENGSGDLDTATAEFIRASCTGRGKTSLMPRAAYAWLKQHWQRLVPSVLVLHDAPALYAAQNMGRYSIKACGPGGIEYKVKGCLVWIRLMLRIPRNPEGVDRTIIRLRTCNFVFQRGFASTYFCPSGTTMTFLASAVAADQPLCRLPNWRTLP